MLVPWRMDTPEGTRRVWLDTETGRTRLNLVGGVLFDTSAEQALARVTRLALWGDVASVGPLPAELWRE